MIINKNCLKVLLHKAFFLKTSNAMLTGAVARQVTDEIVCASSLFATCLTTVR